MVDTITYKYDYIIIGAGAAGLQLALAFIEDYSFIEKRVLILDSSAKKTNDKTFSFWEEGEGKWDKIVHKVWNNARCVSPTHKETQFSLGNYTYKSIRSIDFYQYALEKIKNSSHVDFKQEAVLTINEIKDIYSVLTKQHNYIGNYVFDSRIEVSIDQIRKQSIYVNQSFLGYELVFSSEVFDEETFTMMDYSHQWQGSTSFMYILPFSKTRALVEYTFFTPFTPEKEVFEKQLHSYLLANFKGVNYQIEAMEYGEIPMTNYDFKAYISKGHIKIGTAAGWVKPSSGYAFKSIEQNIEKLVLGLKEDVLSIGKPKRFKFYDRLLLSILKHENHIGGKLFFEMYKRLNINLLFRFLDEQTSFIEDVKLILKLPYSPFIRALFRTK